MRSRPVATTLVAVTAGLAAVTALHRLSGHRLSGHRLSGRHQSAPALPTATPVPDGAVGTGGGIVLPFARPLPEPTALGAPDAPERADAPTRCGDNGGRTKAGAPCGARATAAGRCHHHRQAA